MRNLLITLSLLFLIPLELCARDALQQKRITHLLQVVESLNGAVFIRNGSEYDAKAAGKHLRAKLDKAGDRVKTAEEFIEGCAARSSISGEPYKIRFSDGNTTETAPFLKEKLQEFDQAQKKESSP
jgi:hypothetical protein